MPKKKELAEFLLGALQERGLIVTQPVDKCGAGVTAVSEPWQPAA